MKIRLQFTLLFAFVVGIILFFFSFSIYYLSENFRQNDFHSRIEDKAITKLKLLLATEGNHNDLLFNQSDKSKLHSVVDHNAVIYDEDNNLLYSDTTMAIPPKAILNTIKTDKIYAYTKDNVEYFGFVYSYQEKNYTIIASAQDQYGKKYISNLKRVLIVRGSIIFVIIFISGWLYAGYFLKPITKIVNQVEKITSSNLNHRLTADNKNDEIGQLTNTFNNMLERIETSFNIQKRLVSNASHELRNPLAAISGQIEVSLMKDRENEEYKMVLTSILKEIKNLRTLSNNLIELANSDVEIMSQKFEKLRIDEVLWDVRDDMSKHKPEYTVNIQFNEITDNENLLTCKGENNLLKTAFKNIIDNACKFSDNKTVDIKVTIEKSNIILFFTDTGIGMPEAYLKHVFEPFYRGYNVQGVPGNGIGLTLVKRIIKLHGGKIFLRSKPQEGTTVEVVIPNLS
jgi:signal transduction histidine kinase